MILKTAAMTSFFLLIGTMGFSQESVPAKKSPEQHAQKATEKMSTELELTDDQKAKVEKLNLDHAKQMADIRKQIKALHEQGKAAQEEHESQLKEVLTLEQMDKFRELKAQRIEQRKLKHHDHPGAPKK